MAPAEQGELLVAPAGPVAMTDEELAAFKAKLTG